MKEYCVIGKGFNKADPWGLLQRLIEDEWLNVTVSPEYKYAFELIRVAISEGYEVSDGGSGCIDINLR